LVVFCKRYLTIFLRKDLLSKNTNWLIIDQFGSGRPPRIMEF
jgi:hypothetical protein